MIPETARNGLTRSLVAIVLAVTAGGGSSMLVTRRSQTAVDLRLAAQEEKLQELARVDAARVDYIERFVAMEDAFERAQSDIAGLGDWQDSWVRSGELPIDVRQNSRLDELQDRIGRLEELIRELQALHRRSSDGGST